MLFLANETNAHKGKRTETKMLPIDKNTPTNVAYRQKCCLQAKVPIKNAANWLKELRQGVTNPREGLSIGKT